MENGFNSSVEKDLYVCQMFGFTQKALMDYVYNAISEVTGDALVEIDKHINENEELSKHIDKTSQQEGFDKIRDAFSARLDLNVDRLELFSRTNILRVPRNVVLPSDKIQEEYCFTAEDEESIDKEILETMNKIQASYETRVACQKELSTLDKLQKMADQVLVKGNEYSIDDEHLTSTCNNALTLLEALTALEDVRSGSQNEEVGLKTVTPRTKRVRRS